MSRHGAQGFDGTEPEFALGSVTGVRWWNLMPPHFDGGHARLSGVQGAWNPGVNVADCHRFGISHAIPDEDCGCGFWAYWTVEAAPNPWNFPIPILGVIEGYGRTLIGDRGFRCEKARMVALWFSEGTRSLVRNRERPAEAWKQCDAPDFLKAKGKAAVETWHAITGRPMRVPAPPDAAEENDALYRLSVMELGLEELYGVPVYSTRAMMLLRHPPTANYLP